MALGDDLVAARASAEEGAGAGEALVGIVPTEPAPGVRVYLCAYEHEQSGERSWDALDADGRRLADRSLVREAASVAAMCELAEESAGGGDLGELRTRLHELRLTEAPAGIEEAEVAAAELQAALRVAPRVASVAYLDELGAAAARLEQALGQAGGSPFAEAMRSGLGAAAELADEVERTYRGELA